MPALFDVKNFNPEVFGKYVENIPNLARDEMMSANILNVRNDLKTMLAEQTGGNFITLPMFGLLDGEPDNYDGVTDITASTPDTYTQGMVAIGRAKGFLEKDFSYDITKADFMDNVGKQINKYWTSVDQRMLLSILKGIFAMTGADNTPFVTNHTLDISSDATNNTVTVETLNNAIQKACGDNKRVFKAAFMHSKVATSLENQNLLQYLKYTDAQGVQRNLDLATWNGRLVFIDDNMPTETKGTAPNDYTVYTTYILGEGSFTFCDVGAMTPYEMSRNPSKNGGETTLYTRKRKVFAPAGISFTKSSMASLSPTTANLEAGANWAVVTNGQTGTGKKVLTHKSIPIARIITRG